MKKILTLALVLSLVFAVTACGAQGETNTTSGEETTSAPEVTTVAEEETTVAEDTTAAEEDTTATDETPSVMTYAEYEAAELETAVVVETYVQAKQSWWEDKATIYTQDEDGAYFIYDMACSAEDYALLVPGTKIRVSGYKAQWAGEIEIIDATFEIIEGNYIAEATDVTELLDKDELIQYQNRFVSFKGMTVESAGKDADGNDVAFLYKYNGTGVDGDDLYFNVSKDGKTYTFTVESYLCDNTTDVYAAVKALKIGDVIDMEGFLYWYEGVNPHITSVTAAK